MSTFPPQPNGEELMKIDALSANLTSLSKKVARFGEECYTIIHMEKAKKKSEKTKKVYGKYVVDRSEADCRRAQFIRTALIIAANALLAGMLFIPTDSFTYMFGVAWLNTLYIIVVLTLVVVAVIASVFASRAGKFQGELSEKYAPGRGLDSRLTFAVFELDFLLRAGWTALQIYITVMAFDAAGSILSCMAAISMLCSFAVRTYTAWFYKGHTVFTPSVKPVAPAAEIPEPQAAEDFYATVEVELSDGVEEQKQTAAMVAEASEEAEDFYGDGQ